MEGLSISSFNYRTLQQIAKKRNESSLHEDKISLRSSRQKLYTILHKEGIIARIITPISFRLPVEIIEHIISYDIDLINVFGVTSHYWYSGKLRPTWFKRAYRQFGYYIPFNNKIPLRILYSSTRPIYGNKLVKVYNNDYTTYNIESSVSIISYRSKPLIITANNKYKQFSLNFIFYQRKMNTNLPFLHVNKEKELWYSRNNKRRRICMDSEVVKMLELCDGNIHAILTGKGKLYVCNMNRSEYPTTLYHKSLVRDIVVDNTHIFCLTYTNQVYMITAGWEHSYWKSISRPPGIITSINVSNNRLYFIVNSCIYFKSLYDNTLHKIDTIITNVKYVTCIKENNGYLATVYASINKVYKTQDGSTDHFTYPLNLKSISGIKECEDNLYILGI